MTKHIYKSRLDDSTNLGLALFKSISFFGTENNEPDLYPVIVLEPCMQKPDSPRLLATDHDCACG